MVGLDRKATTLKILLLTLLLAVQALGQAHAIDHAVKGDSSFCSICSVTGHNDGAAAETCGEAIATPQPQPAPVHQHRARTHPGSHLPEARAPPFC